MARRKHSTHKSRSAWFQARTTWPWREGSAERLAAQRRRVKQPSPIKKFSRWRQVGPTNIGGRMTSVVAHPADPDLIWASAAGGGVWKSADAGRTWTPLWHKQDVLNVGSLAIDPQNPDVLYCGSGEANLSADSYPGVGLYRSSDGGKKWNLLASSKKTGIPRRIGAIAIDPFDSKHIRIAGVTHSGADPGGLFVSRDGGVTWMKESFVGSQTFQWCHDVKFHPTVQGTIFATFSRVGSQNGIWQCTDGGQSWSHLTSGLPSSERFHRTTLAFAPSNPETVYALAADALSMDGDGLLGVFRSKNRGKTWTDITPAQAQNALRREGQMSYGNAIAVHPQRPNHVLCGGVDLHLTTDGGATWKRVTRWNAPLGAPDYAHADHHHLLMPASVPGRVYDMNDGGMDVSEDGGLTWSNRSNGLAATMFYDVDVAPSDIRHYGGGAQDNGTVVTTTGRADKFFEKFGGDGGWMIYDPLDPAHLWVTWQFMNLVRFRGEELKEISLPLIDEEMNGVWMVFLTLDPNDTSKVFTGSCRMWRSKNDGSSWKAVSPIFDGSPISAIEVAPADSKRVYAGTENGGFFRSLDGGDTWSGSLAGGLLPGRVITRIETHPQDGRWLLITVAGENNSHVFESKDGGSTWKDLDGGRLPKAPHHAVVIPPDDPQSIFVCSDAGVHHSPDFGLSWTRLNRNLPNTMVVDLVYHQTSGTLTAATYGRSIWRLKVR
jgi:photosystem II stability/assembly factor-like uncharacterized protein